MACAAKRLAFPILLDGAPGSPAPGSPGPKSPHLFLIRETAPRYGDEADRLPPPDPFADDDGDGDGDGDAGADAWEALEEEIVVLSAHIHAATHRLLELIAEYDRSRGWELGGHRSCAHWLAYRTGIDMGAAREKVRAARALQTLPLIGASMARGELSFSKVRALTRVANPESEGDLVELARGVTAASLERMVRAFSKGTRAEEEVLERRRHESRCLSVFPDDDGMYVVRGRLPAEVGAMLMRAVEAASDVLFRKETELKGTVEVDGVPTPIKVSAETLRPVEDSEKGAAQRRADALGLLAERALAVGFAEGPVSGSRAGRYQVLLHVESETLRADGNLGRSDLEDGTRVSAETSRRLSCDAGVVRVEHGGDGNILSVGRKTRTISPALRRALEVRDQGCRFPGCGSRYCDAHHVRHWADGGETSLENCLLLCGYHHRLVHEEGWCVEWWGEGRPAFRSPRGWIEYEGRWKEPIEMKDVSAETLVRNNRALGVTPDEWMPSARWKREWDIPLALLERVWEGVG